MTAVLAWLAMLSYFQRGPMLIGQTELVMAMLMFYLCLGPCGARFSLDRLLAKRRHRDQAVQLAKLDQPRVGATISLRLIQVHLTVAYLMMGLAKMNSVGWLQGDAVWWIAARPDTRLIDLTGVLADQIYLINAWSHAIVIFELAFAVFIWNRLARPLLLLLAVPMWCSLAVISGLSTFSLAMLVANLAFVSPCVLLACCRRQQTDLPSDLATAA